MRKNTFENAISLKSNPLVGIAVISIRLYQYTHSGLTSMVFHRARISTYIQVFNENVKIIFALIIIIYTIYRCIYKDFAPSRIMASTRMPDDPHHRRGQFVLKNINNEKKNIE
jgi:hypothetical protein